MPQIEIEDYNKMTLGDLIKKTIVYKENKFVDWITTEENLTKFFRELVNKKYEGELDVRPSEKAMELCEYVEHNIKKFKDLQTKLGRLGMWAWIKANPEPKREAN